MTLDPALQKAITDALAILIPVLVSWLVAKLTASKATVELKKDVDAGFEKARALEDHIGIETKIKDGVLSVSSRSTGEILSEPRPVLPRQGG